MQSRGSQGNIPAPNSVLKSRFIIRTRSQVAARNASRRPLQDSLTNSPTKSHRTHNPFSSDCMEVEKTESSVSIKKRARSSSFNEENDTDPIFKKSRLGSASPRKAHSADSTPSPLGPAIIKPTPSVSDPATCAHSASTTPTTRPTITPAPNKDIPILNMLSSVKPVSTVSSAFPSPAISTSVMTIDLFNPPTSHHKCKSPSKPFLYERLSRPSVSSTPKPAPPTVRSNVNVGGNVASDDVSKKPLPAPQLFSRATLSAEGRAPETSTKNISTYRDRNMSMMNDDDVTEVLESPSKRTKLDDGSKMTLPKVPIPGSSMIPRRTTLAAAAGTFKLKGPTLKPLLASARVVAGDRRVAGSSGKATTSRPAWNSGPGRQTKLNFAPVYRPPTKRSVSSILPAPTTRPPRPNTSMGFNDQVSTNRRTSLHSSTQTSLSNLESALEKLKIPRHRARMTFAGSESGDKSTASTVNTMPFSGVPNTSSAQKSVMPTLPLVAAKMGLQAEQIPPLTSSTAPLAFSDQRNRWASMASRSLVDQATPLVQPESEAETSMSTLQPSVIASNGAKTRLKTLKDCVIYVDVRTDDGSDAGQLFINMLKGLGARILTRLTPSITHVVFKSGSPTTLGKHKLYDEPKPFLVGIGWVVECVERRERADESRFLVDEPGPVVMERRRKSMQPKMVIESALGAGLIPPSPPRPLVSTMEVDFFPSRSALSDGDVTIVASSSSPVIVQASSQSNMPPLERARCRSQAFAPRVSSPLKTTFKPFESNETGDEKS